MKVPRPSVPKPPAENTIALINIVFLMLVFFLIAGSLAPPIDPEIDLADSTDFTVIEPPRAVFVSREAEIRYRGEVTTAEAVVAALREEADSEPPVNGPAIRLAPDGALPAVQLVEIIDTLRQAGAGRITLVTERVVQ